MKYIILFEDMAPYIAEAPNVNEFLKQFLEYEDALNQKMVNILIDSGKMDLPELIKIINTNCCLFSDITEIYSINEEIYSGGNQNERS